MTSWPRANRGGLQDSRHRVIVYDRATRARLVVLDLPRIPREAQIVLVVIGVS